MATRVWSRPTNYLVGLPVKPKCRHPKCGTAACTEYAETRTDVEPDSMTKWEPRCWEHRIRQTDPGILAPAK